jgi:toxin HigB-1
LNGPIPKWLLTVTASGSNLRTVTKVHWGKLVDKQLGRVPDIIARKFRIWVALVEESEIREMRRCKGFHDEPLKGQRQGQRSVRLNKAYRAIYVEQETG